jgi:hypothetical protein
MQGNAGSCRTVHGREPHQCVASFFFVAGTETLLLFFDFGLQRSKISCGLRACERRTQKQKGQDSGNNRYRRATRFTLSTFAHSEANSRGGSFFRFPAHRFPLERLTRTPVLAGLCQNRQHLILPYR